MRHTPEDYTRKGWKAVAALIAVLTAVGFIPPVTVGGIELRRANILADLIVFDDMQAAENETPELFDEAEFEIDMEQVAEQIETERICADTAPRPAQTVFRWKVEGIRQPATAAPETESFAAPGMPDDPAPELPSHRRPDTARLSTVRIPIEGFGADSCAPLRRFCDTLLAARRPVRIAFLGDSFVEGDILTADLREALQTAYGGAGAGFAPMASPLTAFRRTIKTTAKGWTAYNIMQRKNAPAPLRENFYVSGWVCQPAAGASTRWESSDFRRKLDSCTTARVFFIAPHDSRIELTLNDSIRHEFAVEGDPSVRQAIVEAPGIRSFAFRVAEGHERMIGYGALFESEGVVVDNYSIRSNNGQAMFWTNPSVNAQIDEMIGYDLVILQYGLNIMQSGIRSYGNYAAQIEKMIAFVRQCFPGADILVLGVSDRSVKGESGYAPMDAVPHMTEFQRQAARNTEAAFWPTAEAMQALGGMAAFVRNGWAGKDFTHINYGGGRQVARALYDALNDRIRETAARQIRRREALLDSLRQARIDRQLLPATLLGRMQAPGRTEAPDSLSEFGTSAAAQDPTVPELPEPTEPEKSADGSDSPTSDEEASDRSEPNPQESNNASRS